MESISGYSCGDLLFDEDHEISKVIAQRQQLTYESRVEVAYYNVDGRSFKTTPVCIFVAKLEAILFYNNRLKSRHVTSLKERNVILFAWIALMKERR